MAPEKGDRLLCPQRETSVDRAVCPFFHQSSSSGGLLYFGFLRWSFGTIGRDAFTGPTRSRAIARTSFFWSNFVFFFAIPVGHTRLCYIKAEGGR